MPFWNRVEFTATRLNVCAFTANISFAKQGVENYSFWSVLLPRSAAASSPANLKSFLKTCTHLLHLSFPCPALVSCPLLVSPQD